MSNTPERPGLADKRGPKIETSRKGVPRCEFHLDVVCLPAVRIVEPTIIPEVGATRSQVPNDGQPAQFALAQRRIGVPPVAFELSLSITRGLQPKNPATQQAVALEDQRWLGKSAQWAKWSFCLTTARMAEDQELS